MGIIDRYIIKKYLGTFAFMLVLLSLIVIMIDVLSKSPKIEENGFTIGYFMIYYYPFWMVYLIMTFMAILVFISVIYFTSRLANNTEIVAIISSGASFHRFVRPYMITSLVIALFSLGINHFLLPWANVQKNKLEPYLMNDQKKEKIQGNTEIAIKLSAKQYVFIHNYNRKENRGSGFLLQEFDDQRKLVHQIMANEIHWDNAKQKFLLSNYLERWAAPKESEKLGNGDSREISFGHTPEELFPTELSAQTKTTPELIKFINQEKIKGNSNMNAYLNELHQRTSMPIAVVILAMLALSLSSQKKRGGLGVNLAVGIGLAMIFVFSFETMKVISNNKTLSPMLAMWLPNLVFAPVALYLYFKRANQ